MAYKSLLTVMTETKLSQSALAQMVALDVYVKPLTVAQEAYRESVRREMGLETAESRRNMSESVEAAYEKRLAGMWKIEPRASVADFVDHIDHVVKIAGIDHVGIASDFDGGGSSRTTGTAAATTTADNVTTTDRRRRRRRRQPPPSNITQL